MFAIRMLSLLLALVVLLCVSAGRAEEPKEPAVPAAIEVTELGPQHDGQEVTVVIKITKTQLIGGDREGKYPHVKLHYPEMKMPPFMAVYAKGDLADLLHRFAFVSPDDKFVGRTIKATGKLKVIKDFPKEVDQTPVYMLDLRDWKKFQILPVKK